MKYAFAALALLQQAEPFVSSDVAHPGVDQIYWTPTLAQAEEAAKASGRPIYMMGYVASWDGW